MGLGLYQGSLGSLPRVFRVFTKGLLGLTKGLLGLYQGSFPGSGHYIFHYIMARSLCIIGFRGDRKSFFFTNIFHEYFSRIFFTNIFHETIVS